MAGADRLIVYRDESGDWRWRVEASNGRVLADSAEGYKRRTQVMKQGARVTGRTPLWGPPDDEGTITATLT